MHFRLPNARKLPMACLCLYACRPGRTGAGLGSCNTAATHRCGSCLASNRGPRSSQRAAWRRRPLTDPLAPLLVGGGVSVGGGRRWMGVQKSCNLPRQLRRLPSFEAVFGGRSTGFGSMHVWGVRDVVGNACNVFSRARRERAHCPSRPVGCNSSLHAGGGAKHWQVTKRSSLVSRLPQPLGRLRHRLPFVEGCPGIDHRSS